MSVALDSYAVPRHLPPASGPALLQRLDLTTGDFNRLTSPLKKREIKYSVYKVML